MGCGCGQTKFVPPTRDQILAADDAALSAAATTLRGRRAPGYTWNGPQPASEPTTVPSND